MRHGAVAAPEVGQDRGWGRLHPEAHPRHTTAPIRDESLELRVLGIALDGHLGVVATRYGVEDGEQLVGAESRGRAATEEHRGGRRQSVGLGEFDLGDHRLDVGVHEIVAVGVRGKGAVVTTMRAERHVYVDAEVAHGPTANDARASAKRRSASRRSSLASTIAAG